ncbi:hypothetical protein NEUTE2DRAFT_69289 [Neurospora tetrasperma FGSC 2509]|nr:hypothetical protein NEUTE2DRAFT_69289 [Neurospora tetrasperma FGSC 2509]
MTDWYDNCVSLHDKREGWLQGLVLAYGIFSEELVIVGRHGTTRTRIVTAFTYLPCCPEDSNWAGDRASNQTPAASVSFRTQPTLAPFVYRTPAVLNHHDGCNVRSVRESGNRRPVGGWLPQVTQMPADISVISTLPSCPKAFEPDDSESTRPGIASERSESQRPINPS